MPLDLSFLDGEMALNLLTFIFFSWTFGFRYFSKGIFSKGIFSKGIFSKGIFSVFGMFDFLRFS